MIPPIFVYSSAMLNLKLAVRTLFKSPFVTIVAVVSLALGIGANTAIFSLFHQLILRSLPVQEPSRLVNLSAPGPKPGSQQCNQAGDCDVVFSYPMFRDLERVQTSFTGIAAHRLFGANLAYRGQTLSGEGVFVSGSYFPVLGALPALGRLLGPSDDRSIGDAPVAVLSHAWWQSRFGADPNVAERHAHRQRTVADDRRRDGARLHGNDARRDAAGVCADHAARHPAARGSPASTTAANYWVYLSRGLKPGVSLDQATTAINVPYRQIVSDVEAPLQQGMSDQTMAKFKAKGDRDRGRVARPELGARRGRDAAAAAARRHRARPAHRVRQHRQPAARARGGRANEMAIRLSIGASRLQLIAQLLVESCLLAVARRRGRPARRAAGRWISSRRLLPDEATTTMPSTLDTNVLLFARRC